MPSRAEVSTISRTASMPARWPSTRGRCAVRGPAAVAVHDDRDVPRQARRSRAARTSASSGEPAGTAAQQRRQGTWTPAPAILAKAAQYRTATSVRPAAGAVGPRPAIAGGQNAGHRSGRPQPAADLGERADDGAHHVPQEAVAFDVDDDLAARLSRRQPVNGADGVCGRTAPRLKRREVVPADEDRARRAASRSRSRGSGACHDEPALERRHDGRRRDAVSVDLAAAWNRA